MSAHIAGLHGRGARPALVQFWVPHIAAAGWLVIINWRLERPVPKVLVCAGLGGSCSCIRTPFPGIVCLCLGEDFECMMWQKEAWTRNQTSNQTS